MALNFPDSPTLNEVYTDSASGFSYQWNGTVWQSYESSTASNIQELDDISGSFNGVTTTFALTIRGQSVTPVATNQLIISIGGVMQNPTDDFYISGSNIVFTTPPTNGLTFFGTLLGTALSLNTIVDGSVTPLKLSTGGPSWNTDGDVVITGIGTTALLVNGNARVTGILTVGTSSITLDGSNNQINVGTGLTLSSGGITAGIITATSFSGDGSGLSGIVTPLQVSSFSPASGATGVGYTSNIVITYNSPVAPGIGSITLRTDSFDGTIIESFDVQTSDKISINQSVVTIDPTSNFESLTNYYLVVPSGAFVSNQNVGLAITTYNFTVEPVSESLFAWGPNQYGELGQNNTPQYSSPVQIPGTTWSSVSADSDHSLATKTDGTLWSWGNNFQGQLGQSNRTLCSSPVQIPGTTWSSISAGDEHSLATKTDGTLWSWGNNVLGQLGQNNTTFYSSPIQIPGTTWSSISAGNYYSLATKTDGTLWAWGNNNNGQLGQNNTTQYSSPVQIPGTTWSSISGGVNSPLATKTDGTLWAWGSGSLGSLGQNNTTPYSSPVQIPGTTWSSISGGSSSLATKTDGTLWAWGYNTNGSLGLNDTTYYSSPVQIPGTSWSSISAGVDHSLATKTDGTLWSWGNNNGGELGQNDRTEYSSPVQIPGIGWGPIDAGNTDHSLAIKLVTG